MNLVCERARRDARRRTAGGRDLQHELDANYAVEHVSVKPGRYVMLAVSDTGVGMDRQTVAHISNRFSRPRKVAVGQDLAFRQCMAS